MHIITGLLISALLGKKSGSPRDPGLVSFRNILEIRHSLPGRLRLYAPCLKTDTAPGEHLTEVLTKAEGIEGVEVSPVTGTALIRYKPEQVDGSVVFGATLRILDLESEVEKAPESLVSSGIRNGSDALNRALYEKSGGIIDLWTAIPVGLLIVGLYKMLKPGGLGVPGGFTLLWWAYMQLFRKETKQ